MQESNDLTEWAEQLGLGAGGLLLLRIFFWFIPKLKLLGCNCKQEIAEIKRVQNATIRDIKEDREAFTEYIKEFTEAVHRVDNIEGNFDDRRAEVNSAFEIGDNRFNSLDSLNIRIESRLKSLESEDKLLNKSIGELSKTSAVMMATIEPIKKDVNHLKSNQDKIFDLLTQMNGTLNQMVGKIGI